MGHHHLVPHCNDKNQWDIIYSPNGTGVPETTVDHSRRSPSSLTMETWEWWRHMKPSSPGVDGASFPLDYSVVARSRVGIWAPGDGLSPPIHAGWLRKATGDGPFSSWRKRWVRGRRTGVYFMFILILMHVDILKTELNIAPPERRRL